MRRLSWVAALLAAAIFGLPGNTAAQSESSRTQLELALSLVECAAQAAGPERQELAGAALQALEADRGLAANGWLREPLAASPPEIDRARSRLLAVRAALDRSAGEGPSIEGAHARLVRILNNPPFRAWDPLALLPDWLAPVVLAIIDLVSLFWRAVRWPFDRFFDLLGDLMQSPIGTAGILLLALLIACGLVSLYRFGLRSAIVAQAEMRLPGQEMPPTARSALELAQQHASAGRHREACHFVFLATLLWIEEHAQTRFDPTATNREHLAQVANQPSVAGALAPVVAYFDRLWYGQETVGEADYRALLGLAAHVREAAP